MVFPVVPTFLYVIRNPLLPRRLDYYVPIPYTQESERNKRSEPILMK